MYVRSTPRRNKDGTAVRYLQLVHNEWDPAAKAAKVRVLHNFGREDQAGRGGDRAAGRVAAPAAGPGPGAALRRAGPDLSRRVRPLGGPWRAGRAVAAAGDRRGPAARLLKGRRPRRAAERVLFALVANRALAPSSKLAAAAWVGRDAWIDRPARDQRRRVLPGDGLAAPGRGRAGEGDLRPGREPAQPRGRPAVLRHHQHVLRDR